MPKMTFELNGKNQTVDVPSDMPVLWVLRDVLNLTGTKYGCGVGVCGACVIHVNGRKEQCCQLAAERVDGAKVTTIEGLSPDARHPLQTAWLEEDVPQCGYCQAGQIMQAAALLAKKPQPTDADIDNTLVDNVCRCGTYQRIRTAVHRAASVPGTPHLGRQALGLSAAAVAGAVVGGANHNGSAANGSATHGAADSRSAGRRSASAEGGAASSPVAAMENSANHARAKANGNAPEHDHANGLTRRDVLRGAAAFQLAAVLGDWTDLVPRFLNTSGRLAGAEAAGLAATAGQPQALSAWIAVDTDELVTITVSRSEMGQGVRTSLAMIVAEELDADWSKVRIAQADANQIYGNQLTVGSQSTRTMWTTLRTAGATARAMLVAAAAQAWGVTADTCRTEPGAVVHDASGRRLTYGALAAQAAKQAVPPAGQVVLKDPSKFRIVGQSTQRVDNTDVVSGKAVYGMDVRLPGMLYAVVARPPAFGGKISAFDDADAMKVAGVKKVVAIPSGVAVVADNTWAALQGRDTLKLTLDPGPNADLDDAKVNASLEGAIKALPALPADAARTLAGTYHLPYLAHATMEPMNCVADVKPTGCEIWAPTQGPAGIQQAVGRILGRTTPVTVHVTLMGGGFGRRAESDYAEEAVHISRAVGAPVLLTWTRADDMKNDRYRPASVHKLAAALDGQGKLVAWQHHAAQAVNGGGAASVGQVRPPYQLPSPDADIATVRLAVPTGFWRSVGFTQLTFTNESFIDEIAAAADQDPYELRRGLIQDARLRAVLEKAATESGWGERLPSGTARGIACVDDFGSYCAVVAQVSVAADGKVTVQRMTAAVDVGIVINPRTIEAQIQGALADGVATALKVKITLAQGGVQENHWNDYPWLRLPEMPMIDVHIISSQQAPTGVGEVGYPAAAPAIANAIYAATGKRVRHLPIRPEDLAGWTAVPTATPGTVPTATPTQPAPTEGPGQPTAVPTASPNGHKVYLPTVERG